MYIPMFFTQDRPFEEFYCVCIQLLNKTWKEMRATAEDFTKVSSNVAWHLVAIAGTTYLVSYHLFC